jgi:hypothetical protein
VNSKLEIIDPFHDPNNFFMLPNQVSNVGMSLLQGSIRGATPNNYIFAVVINMLVVSSFFFIRELQTPPPTVDYTASTIE